MRLLGPVVTIVKLFVRHWPTDLGGYGVRYIYYRRRMRFFTGRFNIGDDCTLTGLSQISIGRGTNLSSGVKLHAHESDGITIGCECSFNHNVIVDSAEGGRIKIGDGVLVGPNVVIRAANHAFSDTHRPIRSQGHVSGLITIEDDVWLGSNVVVLPNVRIGSGSVVGAGSIVTRNLPRMCVAAGVPARVVRFRIESE